MFIVLHVVNGINKPKKEFDREQQANIEAIKTVASILGTSPEDYADLYDAQDALEEAQSEHSIDVY